VNLKVDVHRIEVFDQQGVRTHLLARPVAARGIDLMLLEVVVCFLDDIQVTLLSGDPVRCCGTAEGVDVAVRVVARRGPVDVLVVGE